MRHTQSTLNLQVGLPGEDGQVIKWTDLRPGRYMLAKGPLDRLDVCVARVSTEDQVRDGLSLQVQIELAMAAAGGNGHHITSAYVDPGLSASKLSIEERPGMAALLADIKRGRIRSVYGYKRDRLSRDTSEWLSFLSTCASHGVKIAVTCPEELPVGQGAYGRFTETLVMSIAELETQLIRMRVKDSMISRFREGHWLGGQLPYGLLQAPDKTIQPHPQEAPIVKEIFRLAVDEMLGAMRIAQRLNAEYPLSFRGHSWTRLTVRRVLTNRTYCGYLHLKAEVEQEDGSPLALSAPKSVASPLGPTERRRNSRL